MKGVIEEAKKHAKENHKQHWNFWANQGKVIFEMFRVVTKQRGEKT